MSADPQMVDFGALARRAVGAGVPAAGRDDLAADDPPARKIPAPLFDTEAARFGRFLLTDPPERRWLLDGVLPLGVAGLLASMGGAGKSQFAYQLLMSAATGWPLLGMTVGEVGGVLYLAAEDDEGELHRRGRTLLDHLPNHAELREAIAERLHVVSRVAENNLLTASSGDGDVHRTPLVGRLIEAAQRIDDIKLIVLDPISRFRGGRANHEEDATRFVEALEAIRQATGATVLGLAHVSQSGIKDGGGQEIVRGSTALVDGVRWVATLQRLKRDHAADYGVPEDEADRYLRLEIPKSNYTAPFPGLWIRREAGGVLVETQLERQADARREAREESRYLAVVANLQSLLQRNGPLTRNKVRQFAGKSGVLGVGDQTVRAVIERAVRDGSLTDTNGVLTPPEREAE